MVRHAPKADRRGPQPRPASLQWMHRLFQLSCRWSPRSESNWIVQYWTLYREGPACPCARWSGQAVGTSFSKYYAELLRRWYARSTELPDSSCNKRARITGDFTEHTTFSEMLPAPYRHWPFNHNLLYAKERCPHNWNFLRLNNLHVDNLFKGTWCHLSLIERSSIVEVKPASQLKQV
jgi:hypothetical protein